MDQVVIVVMAGFMTLGALDKAFFDGRFGYGTEFEKGLNTMGPLTIAMVGIMCVAPTLGTMLAPVLAPFFLSIGSDPALFPGIILGVDAGGLPLARTLAQSPQAVEVFGIGLCSTLACIMTLTLPFSLAMAAPQNRPFVAKGIAAGIIASPFSMLGVGWTRGYDTLLVLKLGAPAFVVAAVLVLLLTLRREGTIRAFMVMGRVLMGAFALLLAVAALQHYFPITIIPGMAPIEPQLTIVGEIGIMLAGAYPMVFFVKKYFSRGLSRLAALLRVDDDAALGMLVSIANPLPMYAMIDRMSHRGMVLCSAFGGPVLCMLGDHLGFMSAYYPEGIEPLIAGKAFSAVVALVTAMGLERLAPSAEG